MTQISSIITDAFRESNIVSANNSPTTSETNEALRRLNGLVNLWVGTAAGELLFDWFVPQIGTAPREEINPRDVYSRAEVVSVYPYIPIQSRIVTSLAADTTVYLPQYPNDGSRVALANAGSIAYALTISANGRKIEGASELVVDLAARPTAEWFFRADLQDWVLRQQLELTSESPFPIKFDQLLICGLAIRLASSYGKDPEASTVDMFNKSMAAFRAQYKQYTPTENADNIRAYQSFRLRGGYGRGNSGFFS